MNPLGASWSRRQMLAGLAGSALAGGITAMPQRRALAADFYQGKTITMIVGFAPGGGVDSTARVVARHLVRHIPGQPGIVVQNMEGAAGLVAANYLGRRVAPDGLTVAVPGRSWFVEGVVKSPGVAFDVGKVSYIGSPGAANSMIYVRSSIGINSVEDLKASPRTLAFGALGSATPTAMLPVLLARQGIPIRVILGYVSTARVLVALEQGEIDGAFTVEDSFARRQDLIRDRVVTPIAQSQAVVPGLPVVRDMLPAADWPLLALVLALDSFGLPLVGPPDLPADRVEILRDAFLSMCSDPEYRTEAARAELPVGAPLSGAQLVAMVGELAGTARPEVVAAYRALVSAK
jgi:hypothetical protein